MKKKSNYQNRGKIGQILKIASLALTAGLASLMVACGSTQLTSIHSLEDLKGKNISAQSGTQGEDLAVDLVGKDKVIGFAQYADAITALKQGKVDATIMDGLPAEKILLQQPDLRILPESLSSEAYAIAFAKDNSALKQVADEVIAELKEKESIKAWVEAFQHNEEEAAQTLDYNATATGGELVMGTEAGFAPYESKLGDKIVGVDVALAQAIAKKLNKKLLIVDMSFDALIPAVQSGKVDLVVAGMTITAEREQQVLFSTPYFDAKQVVVVRGSK